MEVENKERLERHRENPSSHTIDAKTKIIRLFSFFEWQLIDKPIQNIRLTRMSTRILIQFNLLIKTQLY